MGTGYLKIETFVGDHVLPINNSRVLIKDKNGRTLQELYTDDNGISNTISLHSPDKSAYNLSKNTHSYFSVYDVEVSNPRFATVNIIGVQIFDGIESILPVQLHPISPDDTSGNIENIIIPLEHGVDFDRELSEERHIEYDEGISDYGKSAYSSRAQMPLMRQEYSQDIYDIELFNLPKANEVAIPNYITVHLGSPNAVTENVTVPFIDYVKNVASSEIFPFWEEAALYANIYAQISFVLNRFYTVWYRSQGKDFDITNSTAFDQYFVKGRNIFENISKIVDNIFNVFIRRQGRREPFFASYCNGTTSTCPGLSQFGSQDLALRGYSAMQILQYYYPDDIQLVESNNFVSVNTGAFPGYSLQVGSTGESVRTMQTYLNRISGNWFIPDTGRPDGVFGTSTKTSTTEFQNLFNLTPDGIIGKSTWYQITRIYVAAKQLGELTSEGERIGVSGSPPTTTIQQDSRGEYVVKLQFLLNYISTFYPTIPYVVQNGVFREETKRAVVEFQKEFGLTQDGIVGPGTWRKLYEIYNAIGSSVEIPPSEPEPPAANAPEFPGTPLRLGSSGSNVSLMQGYLNGISRVYPSIPTLVADGVFGSRTQSAVREFQRLFNLTVDGVIGAIIWYRIIDEYNNLTQGQSPSFPGTALRIGSRGNDVLTMQNFLREISSVFPIVPSPAADGIFGAGTQASVMAFQRLFGLSEDGVIGKYTWDKIVYVYGVMPDSYAPRFPGSAIRLGDRGSNVLLMQNNLNAISPYYSAIPQIVADGVFGNNTLNAVKAFQNQFGLSADGVIGQTTWNTIVSIRNLHLMNEIGGMGILASSVPRGNGAGINPMLLITLQFMRRYNNSNYLPETHTMW